MFPTRRGRSNIHLAKGRCSIGQIKFSCSFTAADRLGGVRISWSTTGAALYHRTISPSSAPLDRTGWGWLGKLGRAGLRSWMYLWWNGLEFILPKLFIDKLYFFNLLISRIQTKFILFGPQIKLNPPLFKCSLHTNSPLKDLPTRLIRGADRYHFSGTIWSPLGYVMNPGERDHTDDRSTLSRIVSCGHVARGRPIIQIIIISEGPPPWPHGTLLASSSAAVPNWFDEFESGQMTANVTAFEGFSN